MRELIYICIFYICYIFIYVYVCLFDYSTEWVIGISVFICLTGSLSCICLSVCYLCFVQFLAYMVHDAHLVCLSYSTELVKVGSFSQDVCFCIVYVFYLGLIWDYCTGQFLWILLIAMDPLVSMVTTLNLS